MIPALVPHGLAVVGGFHPTTEDGAPPAARTLLLIGADGDRMWEVFHRSAEASDGAADPLDRWSRRVIGSVAAQIGAEALFPFGGPPWQPFIRWAALGEAARVSPVVMQVSPSRGLWASYRGALALQERLNLPDWPSHDPCHGCPAPCLSACPVDAFADGRYDVAACTAHVASPAGTACRSGCLVRRACPAGVAAEPPELQRRFHMDAFLAARRSDSRRAS